MSEAASPAEIIDLSKSEKADALGKAVADLSEEAFKADGKIRAQAMRSTFEDISLNPDGKPV
ncbi:MAG: hypothetical protein HRU33_17955 [Rhodobacteraceae bacterium]|nr:hypothetical protein [Paracoccaceae bacterium]